MKNLYHKNFKKVKFQLKIHSMTWAVSRKNKTNCQLYFHDKKINFFKGEPILTLNFPTQLRKIVAQFYFAILCLYFGFS